MATSGTQHVALDDLLGRVASPDPTPGAGPVLAWTCAMAAALVEMANAVNLRGEEPADPAVAERDRDHAARLRVAALALADADAEAYGAVLAARRSDRDAPDRAARIRRALSDATEPLVSIVETGGELARLGADAAERARGGVRGEAVAAARLGAAVARAGVGLVELNLGGASGDPRIERVRGLAELAGRECDRVGGP